MDVTDVKICPLLSIRKDGEACVEADCALWLEPARKCSLVFMGYRAMMEVQQLKTPAATKA